MIILIGAGIVGYSLASYFKIWYEKENTIKHKEPILDFEMIQLLEENDYVELKEWRDENGMGISNKNSN